MGFAIGVERIKTGSNIGTLWRSAYNFGASMLFTVGARYRLQPSDCVHAWRHIPLVHYLTWEEFRAHAPHGWIPVGVEITAESRPLATFVHPREAVYILGPEDGSLSPEALRLCRAVVSIPSRLCLNVAVAGSIVMYDRAIKAPRDAERAPASMTRRQAARIQGT